MAGDISRSTFRRTNHYSGVRMQQGRVEMDADWNEQVDISHYLTRTACRDLIGPAGAPAANAGFGLSVANSQYLLIGPGRLYVDGLLCENDETLLWAPNPTGYTSAGSAMGGSSPALNVVSPVQVSAGVYAVYLDAWERDITALDDPELREIALGGPDTATRTKTVWQVKLLRLSDLGSKQTCGQDWSKLLPASTATLVAMAEPDPAAATPCSVEAQAGYRSLENQLYRVQIHQVSPAGTATFKWSRDNASVAARWTGVDAANSNHLLVSTLGPDSALGFAAGQWIELTDDRTELAGNAGTLVQLTAAAVIGQSPTLTIDPASASGPVSSAAFPVNPKIRRWDHAATATTPLSGGAVPVVEGTPIALENGVQVTFTANGTYAAGDFWTIPARTATAISAPTVEWPADASGNPLAQPSEGVHHAYASLALLSVDAHGTLTMLDDCRLVFGPAAHTPSFHVVDVRCQQPAEEFANDSIIALTSLLGGFAVVCDAPVEANTLSPATCQVTIDLPLVNTTFDNLGYYPAAMTVVLTGNATSGGSAGNTILWNPTAECRAFLSSQMEIFSRSTRRAGLAIVRLKLRGAFISRLGVPSSHLDGYTEGALTSSWGGQTYLPNRLPSGNGGAGSDFETWLWVASDNSFPRPSYSNYGSGFQGIGGELL